MRRKHKDHYVEDNAQLNALEEFAPRIREIIRGLRDERQLAVIANRLGFHPSRLTEMITKDEKGNYRREITPYYLGKLIDGGVMSVRDILNGRRLEDLPDRARLYFERFMLPKTTIQLIVEAQDRGFDVDRILKEILHPSLKKRASST